MFGLGVSSSGDDGIPMTASESGRRLLLESSPALSLGEKSEDGSGVELPFDMPFVAALLKTVSSFLPVILINQIRGVTVGVSGSSSSPSLVSGSGSGSSGLTLAKSLPSLLLLAAFFFLLFFPFVAGEEVCVVDISCIPDSSPTISNRL